MTDLGLDSLSEGVHPDLKQSRTRILEANKRYYLYEGSCYLLHASCVPIAGAANFTGRLFTTEDPDRASADINLSAIDQNNPHTKVTYFPFGVYIDNTGTDAETALISIQFIRRADYVAAYPATECKLVAAWKADPCNKGAYLDNFDQGIPEREPWSSDGGASSTVTTPAEFTDDVFRILDDGDETKKIAFQASGITTGTTRTITMPDADVDLGSLGGGSDTDIYSAKKTTSGTITIGEVVYADSYVTDALTVELADGDAVTLQPPTGVAAGTITDATAGNFQTGGVLEGFDTSSWSDGDTLYLSDTPGALTDTRPENERVWVMGTVIHSHASNGSMLVKIEEVRGLEVVVYAGKAPGSSTVTRVMGPSPIAGTVTDVKLCTSKSTTSDGSKHWDIRPINSSNGGATLLQADYDTFADGDITAGTDHDLGAVSSTAANLVIAVGDIIGCTWTETGTMTSMDSNACWLRITLLPDA